MKPHVRRDVVAALFAHLDQDRINFVFDHQDNEFHNIIAEPQKDGLQTTINGMDLETNTQFGGAFPKLYHFGEESHLHLEDKGDGTYQGYDYGGTHHFVIHILDRKAQFYDYAEGAWFNYAVQD